jgi:hypothetical protein
LSMALICSYLCIVGLGMILYYAMDEKVDIIFTGSIFFPLILESMLVFYGFWSNNDFDFFEDQSDQPMLHPHQNSQIEKN